MKIEWADADQHMPKRALRYPLTTPQSYCVELPLDLLDEQGRLLDWVIGYAFETLEARHLDLRIVAVSHPPFYSEVQKD